MQIEKHINIFFRIVIPLLLMNVSISYSQKVDIIEIRYGIVSYISTQNIYVKFENTDSISIGDTLFYKSGILAQPAVIVKYISSKSCAGEKIGNIELKLDYKLFAKITLSIAETKITVTEKDVSKPSIQNLGTDVSAKEKKSSRKNYWGKFSAQSMSSISNQINSDDQRWRYSFSLNADSINDTGFSFSSYLFFAYNIKNWDEVKSNIGNALKIYDLSIGYSFNKNNKIGLGRFLNPKISNVGSIDGIQYQNQFGNYYMGAVIGSRPSFTDYGYDVKMFEFGGYIGRTDTIANSQMENTIAFMNQTNNYKTDRRYIYLQHTNNILANTSIFASSELDLYKVEKGIEKSSIDLTSLFLSVNVNPSRYFSFSLSYDARKNAIYYETYKTYLENLLSNELRQGYRGTIYVRPFNNISISINGGYSYQSKDPKPARNFGGNLYFSDLPIIKASASISYSKLISSYTNGTISGLRLNKYLDAFDMNLSIDYKNIRYEFDSGMEPMLQNIASGEISFKLPFGIYFGLNYEGVFEKQSSWGRFFVDLTKRF